MTSLRESQPPLTTQSHILESEEEARKFYKSRSTFYDEEMSDAGYNGPLLGAQYLDKHATELGWNKEEVRILDVAAGTGEVGNFLKINYGFGSLDAVDMSEEMLEEARKKGVYTNLICFAMGNGAKMPIEDDTYDGLVVVGAFNKGHLTSDQLLEMMRVVRPGGIIVNVMRHEYTWTIPDLCNLLPLYQQLVQEGKLRHLEEVVVPEYFMKKDGLVQVYQVL